MLSVVVLGPFSGVGFRVEGPWFRVMLALGRLFLHESWTRMFKDAHEAPKPSRIRKPLSGSGLNLETRSDTVTGSGWKYLGS